MNPPDRWLERCKAADLYLITELAHPRFGSWRFFRRDWRALNQRVDRIVIIIRALEKAA